MSQKELEGIKSNRVDLKDAPATITPTKVESEVRKDPADKVDCLYVDFYFMVGEDEMTLTNKYRPYHIKVLLARMKAMKIKNIKTYINKLWRLEKEPFGKLGFEKYLPALEE